MICSVKGTTETGECMKEPKLELIISGAQAKEAAEAIKKEVEQILPIKTTITTDRQNSGSEPTKDVDPIALAALIISIPGAILTTADLAKRISNRKKVDQILDKTRIISEKTETTIKTIYPDGTVKEIHQADAVEIQETLPIREEP